MKTKEKFIKNKEVNNIIAQASGGSENFYQHWINANPPIVYTDGARTIANEFQAYWLIDDIIIFGVLTKS
jgi:hypothetical protein